MADDNAYFPAFNLMDNAGWWWWMVDSGDSMIEHQVADDDQRLVGKYSWW